MNHDENVILGQRRGCELSLANEKALAIHKVSFIASLGSPQEKMSNVHGLFSSKKDDDDDSHDERENRFVGGIGAQGGGR